MNELLIRPKNKRDQNALEVLAKELGAEIEVWNDEKEDAALLGLMEVARTSGVTDSKSMLSKLGIA